MTQGRQDDLEQISELLAELTLPDDVAEMRQFTELCRRSLAIRSWLFARFAGEPATRAAFRKLLSGRPGSPSQAASWSQRLTGEVASDDLHSTNQGSLHGGLSRTQVLALIMRHQFERMDLRTFFLVRLWMRFLATGRQEIPVGLCSATLDHWRALITDSEGRLMQDAMRAVRFFNERSKRPIGETDFGYINTWKIHVLLYILDRPKTRYQVAELCAALPQKYRGLDRRQIRRFCQRHGIRRDTKPGERPGSRRHGALHLASKMPATSAHMRRYRQARPE